VLIIKIFNVITYYNNWILIYHEIILNKQNDYEEKSKLIDLLWSYTII